MTTAESLVRYINDRLGLSVYFDHAPRNAIYPCITYKKTSSESNHTFSGPSYAKDVYEFIVLAVEGDNNGINMPLYGIEGARFWAASLNSVLDGYDQSTTSINTAYNEEFDDDSETFQVMQSYRLLVAANAVTYSGSFTGSAQYSEILKGNGTSGSFAVWYGTHQIGETDAITVSGGNVTLKGDLTVKGTINAVISASNESSSYADKAALADYALTASYALNSQTMPAGVLSSSAQVDYNDIQNKPTNILSSSFADTASYVKLPSGVVSASSQIDYNDIQNRPTGSITEGSATASYVEWANIDGKPPIVSASAQVDYADIQNKPTTIKNAETASFALTASYAMNGQAAALPAGLVSSSAQVFENSGVYSSSLQLPAGIVSSSGQINYTDIQNKPTTIESASFAATAAFALNVPTTVSHAVTADTASYVTLPVGLVSSSAQILNNSGVISSSVQVDYADIQNKPTTIETASYVALPAGLVSASAQIADWSVATASYAANVPTTASHAIVADTASYYNLPAGVVSSSAQAVNWSVATASYTPLPAGLVSSSAQIDYTDIQNKPTTIATASYVNTADTASYYNLPSGIVSSSAQVLNGSNVYSSSAQLPAGIVTASSQIDYNGIQNKPVTASYAITASYALNSTPLPAGLFSSSAQVDYTAIQNKPTTIATASYVLNAVSASYSPLPQSPVFVSVGIGQTPTAYLHIKAGTTAAGTAPIKLTSGSLNTTPESGTIEYDGTDFWLTI